MIIAWTWIISLWKLLIHYKYYLW